MGMPARSQGKVASVFEGVRDHKRFNGRLSTVPWPARVVGVLPSALDEKSGSTPKCSNQ
jgi:hypothetical protein